MKHFIYIPFFTMFFFVGQLSAHEGGHGPIPPIGAVVVAKDVTEQFVKYDSGLGFGKLPESWATIHAKNISIHERGEGYYIVSLKNEAEKKTFYVLMSSSGEVYDADFTGKFEGLKK